MQFVHERISYKCRKLNPKIVRCDLNGLESFKLHCSVSKVY